MQMAFDKQNSAGFLANHMARLFANALQQRIRPFGLAPAQFLVLLELWTEDGLTQKDLVERLDVEQATMANTLMRMERDGLVLRKPNPADARSQQVWLTRKARDLETPATGAAASVNADSLSGLSEDERAQFFDIVRRVIDTLRSADRSGHD